MQQTVERMKHTTKQHKYVEANAQNFGEMNRDAPTVRNHEDIQSYIRTGEVLGSLLIGAFSFVARVARAVLMPVTHLGRRVAQAMARGRRRRAAIRELMALDDRILSDIGVRRDDIYSVVDNLLDATPPSEVDTTRREDKIVAIQKASEVAANDDKFESAA